MKLCAALIFENLHLEIIKIIVINIIIKIIKEYIIINNKIIKKILCSIKIETYLKWFGIYPTMNSPCYSVASQVVSQLEKESQSIPPPQIHNCRIQP